MCSDSELAFDNSDWLKLDDFLAYTSFVACQVVKEFVELANQFSEHNEYIYSHVLTTSVTFLYDSGA